MATKKKPKFSHEPTESEYEAKGWVRVSVRFPPAEWRHLTTITTPDEVARKRWGLSIRRAVAAMPPSKK